MAYDEKCYNLANHFLPHGADSEAFGLAQHIQDAVEEWFKTITPSGLEERK